MFALALGQADFAFHTAVFPVHIQRYQGKAFLLDLAHQALDLVFMQQQLFGANRVRPDMGGGCAQGVDLAADDENFTVADDHVPVGELDLAFAHRLDLPAF